MNCYGAFAKDDKIRMLGSSGGIFPVLSKTFIKNGGIVYASIYDESFNVIFKRIDNEIDLEKSFTSKYLQSRLNDTFKSIKADLQKGKHILFSGTSCQASGLRQYLKISGINTDNILILDLICHGVPSEDVFHNFLNENYQNKFVQLNMRSKEKGWNWGNYSWKFTFSNGKEEIIKQSEVPFMKGFLSNLYLRHSCYNCVAKNNSNADITLGDFWGISNINNKIPAELGVSCIITRTHKGDIFFKKHSKDIEYFEVSYNDILEGNPSLEKPVKKPFYRNFIFKKLLANKNFNQTVLEMSAFNIKTRILNKLYSKTPKLGTSTRDLYKKHQRVIFSKKENCCGCSACYSICPAGAVFLKKDHEGFFYPIIDTKKCINCGLCEKVCLHKQQ